MPNQPEEVYGTQTSNNFTQGQSSQQDSEAALSQVCRLFEQSQQQHQEMMNHVINMGNHREPYQPHSKLSELQKTRPSTFAHTDRPLEANHRLPAAYQCEQKLRGESSATRITWNVVDSVRGGFPC